VGKVAEGKTEKKVEKEIRKLTWIILVIAAGLLAILSLVIAFSF